MKLRNRNVYQYMWISKAQSEEIVEGVFVQALIAVSRSTPESFLCRIRGLH